MGWLEDNARFADGRRSDLEAVGMSDLCSCTGTCVLPRLGGKEGFLPCRLKRGKELLTPADVDQELRRLVGPDFCQGCADRGAQLGVARARIVELEVALRRARRRWWRPRSWRRRRRH
jgi:hypothetical protein